MISLSNIGFFHWFVSNRITIVFYCIFIISFCFLVLALVLASFSATSCTESVPLGRLQALYIRLGSKGMPVSEEMFHIDKFLRDLKKNTWNFVQQQRFTMYTFVVVHKTNAIPVLTVLTIPYWLKSFVCFVLFFCQSPNNLWLWKKNLHWQASLCRGARLTNI